MHFKCSTQYYFKFLDFIIPISLMNSKISEATHVFFSTFPLFPHSLPLYGGQSEFVRKRPCAQDNGYNVDEQASSVAGLELAMNN
jgi:hypothetical protein